MTRELLRDPHAAYRNESDDLNVTDNSRYDAPKAEPPAADTGEFVPASVWLARRDQERETVQLLTDLASDETELKTREFEVRL